MGDAARALDNAHEIAKLLDCGLDKETLSTCIALIEAGVNPEASASQPRSAAEPPEGARATASASVYPPPPLAPPACPLVADALFCFCPAC
ncbi:hypothetical protein CHLNCDRAFT_18194 [Chlorella variabilis]|uniref:Mitotic-spindle organizing protein 1 n=1 Tax=Chlorella variabilis TaxID=554065 RepID=E1Z3I2_CHLVA|nr:hypothetical protein CHLNCDRAFT_18194 [Chlorella variabilis]EFN60162.1 hypothetical protein CHLNCDRAFT_18194 [Chlorella variabilis]|eukprot:XP_005852264.1 hypothetical protein CHLNCDRAFT_18194 [Chlorella variabilis]